MQKNVLNRVRLSGNQNRIDELLNTGHGVASRNKYKGGALCTRKRHLANTNTR